MFLTTKIAETFQRSIFFLPYFRVFQFLFDYLPSLFSRLKNDTIFTNSRKMQVKKKDAHSVIIEIDKARKEQFYDEQFE